VNLNSYYSLKPLIPRRLQIQLRRQMVRRLARRSRGIWPITESAVNGPPVSPCWPDGKRFAIVLTHDVEQEGGLKRCEDLADLEEERGLHSAFGFVPRRYQTPEQLRRGLAERGFEVMVHDLYHDGKLFRGPRRFTERSAAINEFLQEWGTKGFSSGAMHHNLPWMCQLDIDYSISTYDVDPFEPQACGLGRIFPLWVQPPDGDQCGFIEMPYTLPQDFTIFVLLEEQSNAIWRRKLDWIAAKGGMALIKTHPDYMLFPGEGKRMDGYPVERYTDLLEYMTARYRDDAWFALPSEVARHWRGLKLAGNENAIDCGSMFCASCRQAHADGWLSQSCRYQDELACEPARSRAG